YRVATLDEHGGRGQDSLSVGPGPPRSHVVVNEVMANPAGPEPAEEWVELYNDGGDTENLAGYTLDDGTAATSLPEAELAPGAFALVVAQAYVADDGVDPAPSPSARIVRVRMLGQNGLSNDGERLVLRDASGAPLSVFPRVKTKNGVSVARV